MSELTWSIGLSPLAYYSVACSQIDSEMYGTALESHHVVREIFLQWQKFCESDPLRNFDPAKLTDTTVFVKSYPLQPGTYVKIAEIYSILRQHFSLLRKIGAT